MRSAPDTTNVVEACTLDGRQERLENMQAMLDLCEKALQARAGARGASGSAQRSMCLEDVWRRSNRPNSMRSLAQWLTRAPPCVRPQEYLETKRVAFPRFYFVSAADLLDILSKGSNPQLIMRHMPKCFDNIDKLSFRWEFARPLCAPVCPTCDGFSAC